MKKNIFLFLFVSSVIVRAQVPGYLGMKNSFGYESNVSVAFKSCNSHFNSSSLFLFPKGWNDATDPKHVRLFALNVSHTFVYDRIIKRNASFTASLAIVKSGVQMDSLQYQDLSQTVVTTTVYKGGPIKISGFALNVSYRHYRNLLAPLGLYSGYSLGFGSSSGMVHNSGIDTSSYTKAHAVTPKFCYLYGRQNVYFDKLIIDRGFSFDMFGFLLGFLSKNRTESTGSDGLAVDPLKYFSRQIKTRMYYRDLIVFYIGGKYMF